MAYSLLKRPILLVLVVCFGAALYLHTTSIFYSIHSIACEQQHLRSSSLSNYSDAPMQLKTFASSSSSSSSNSKALNVQQQPPPQSVILADDPPWWLDEDEDEDWLEREYDVEGGAVSTPLHALRNLSHLKKAFNPMCGHYKFNESALPDVSVIVTSQNEISGWMTTTVHSILARTPPALLREILVIDDNGIPEHIRYDKRVGADEEEYKEIGRLPKVKVIQNHNREGCARSRLVGARAAKGEIVMFVDSHVEMEASTWYQHLVLPILEQPRTLAVQTIDVIDDKGTRKYSQAGHLLGTMGDNFYFSWQNDRFGDWTPGQVEKMDTRLPYPTPIGPGSLFAMRKSDFFQLGGYDEGLAVWGGENTELALKTWMCGGRVVFVPCSRVGHMFRKSPELMKLQWPPKIPPEQAQALGCRFENATNKRSWKSMNDFTKITQRNNIRIMEQWVGDHPAKRAYYKKVGLLGGNAKLRPEWQQYVDELETDPAAIKQLKLKKENKCKDFEWFDKHVMVKLAGKHHPWYRLKDLNGTSVSCGNHRAKTCHKCPQGHGKTWCNGECEWCEQKQDCLPAEDYEKMCKKDAPLKSDQVQP